MLDGNECYGEKAEKEAWVICEGTFDKWLKGDKEASQEDIWRENVQGGGGG